ncbi:retrovirus-related pol polyprotein from transposon TNT 1-94 [Tanacetum coccineum]
MVKSWLVQDQTVIGKDYSNLLIADSLLKTIWFINAPCYGNEALASPKANELTIPEQTATGKGISNPFMDGSLPKTTKPTLLDLNLYLYKLAITLSRLQRSVQFGTHSSEFPDYVCKLDKALYGLKISPRAWYETLLTFLNQNKFTKGRIDNTLFIYKSKGDVLLIQVYVDDIIFGSTSYKLCEQLEKLMTKKFEMSMMGELTYFLGLQIKQDDKGISIYQEQYNRNLLKKYEISNTFSVKTPMVPPNNLGPDLAGKLVNETS